MKKKVFISLICCLFSCSQKQNNNIEISVEKFPIEDKLNCSVITVPPIVLDPSLMFISGKHFITLNPSKNILFDVFSYPDFQYQFSAGVIGGGPNDFSLMIDKKFPTITDIGFKLFMIDVKKHVEVEIDAINHTLNVIKNNSYKFDKTDDMVNGFTQLNDHLFIYNGGFMDDHEYKMLDVKTDKIQPFSAYPKWINSENQHKMFLYLKATAARPDGKYFAAFYANFKRWRIFDNNGTLVKDIAVNIEPLMSDMSDVSSRYVYYNRYPYATNNYIYVFCKNARMQDPHKDEMELQIWDWDGNPVAKYVLNKYLTCFTVDETRKVLYGVNNEEGNEDKIFKYELSALL